MMSEIDIWPLYTHGHTHKGTFTHTLTHTEGYTIKAGGREGEGFKFNPCITHCLPVPSLSVGTQQQRG